MIKKVDLSIENYEISSFIFYKIPKDMKVDGSAVEMVKDHKIPGLLQGILINKGDTSYFRYDLLSDESLHSQLSLPFTKNKLYTYLLSLVETLLDAAKLGLDVNNFVFDSKYIFIDNFSNRLILLYMPIKTNTFEKVSMREFMRELLYSAPFDEKDDVSFFVKLHNYLTTTKEISLSDLRERLTDMAFLTTSSKKEIPNDIEGGNPNYYSPGNFESSMKTSVENDVVKTEYSSKSSEKKANKKLEIEEELQYKRITRAELDEEESLVDSAAVLGGTSFTITPSLESKVVSDSEEQGTTVLGSYEQELEDVEEEGTTALGALDRGLPKPFLIVVATKEKVTVSKECFRIGRDPSQADYASKNRVVGRIHAEVLTVNGEYFIIDKQSRNGTYVNGMKLQPNEKIKIKHEDQIKLANEEFVFRIF